MADEKELTTKALTLAEQVQAVTITSPETFAEAATGLKLIKAMSSEIAAFFAPLKKKAHEAHRAITQAEAEKLAPLVAAEKAVKIAMAAFVEAEERKRRALERQIAEKARKRQEEEQLLDAIDAEAAGNVQAADAILARPVLAPVVMLPSQTPKVAGISFSERWHAVVFDHTALVRAVADGRVPMFALTPNQSWLDGQARALKSDLGYPGVRAEAETSVSSRGAA